MYELFYADRTAAMGTRVILEEIGAEYRVIETDITDHAPRAPEFLALNPNGWVPVLVYEGGSMHEASAITVFPGRPPSRGRACPLCRRFPCGDPSFSGSSTCPTPCRWPISSRYYPWRFCETPDHHESARVRSCARLREIWGFIDQGIGDREWLLGDRFSAADIHLFMLTTWLSPDRGHPTMEEFPSAARIAARTAERASVRKVYKL